MDKRLTDLKNWERAMISYVLMLYEFVQEIRPKRVLEIGVQGGQSTKTILLALAKNDFGILTSIDHKRRGELLDGEYPDVKKYWNFIRGDSHAPETLEAAKEALGDDEYYDILFIDGDHTYEGAKQDFMSYRDLVRPGGLIFMHDTVNRNEGVKELWKEITWEKFNIDWGRTRKAHITPGFGIIRKPLNNDEPKEMTKEDIIIIGSKY